MKDILEVVGVILFVVALSILLKGCHNSGEFCVHWKYDNNQHQACLW